MSQPPARTPAGTPAQPTVQPTARPTVRADADLRVVPVPGPGAEDVVVDQQGRVYTGTSDGSVFRLTPATGHVEHLADTGGRPLGLELLADGRLLVCDAKSGLLALDPASGALEVLATTVAGRAFRFLNNAAVHTAGDIYVSDSSAVHGIDRWEADIAENTASGRLLRVRADGGSDELLTGLRFPNGVALSADESAVVVAETAGRRLLRHWVSGSRRGETEVLVADLPGYPDNVSRGTDGLLWVAVASPTDPVLERVMNGPRLLRALAWRLPESVRPAPRRTARVMAFTDDGALRRDVCLDASRFHMVTGVREHHGTVWLGSLLHGAVAAFDL